MRIIKKHFLLFLVRNMRLHFQKKMALLTFHLSVRISTPLVSLRFPLGLSHTSANSIGSGESARMRRLA